jgi:hypothetical protein
MLTLALAGCGSSGTETLSPSAPSPSDTPAPTESASTAEEVASAIAEVRPQLTKIFDEFRANRCTYVLRGDQPGVEAATCVANKIASGSYSQALSIKLESLKPWPDEIQSLTQQTMERLETVSSTYDMDDAQMFDTAALLLNSKLQGWDPYL